MPKFTTNRRALLLAALAFSTACMVRDTEIPPLTGPSEFALSLTMSALPDLVTIDGVSQSVIVVTARNFDGSPRPNVQIRLDMLVNNVIVDYGTLSPKTVFTGSDGRASAVYRAPPAPQPGGSIFTDTIMVLATYVATNQQSHQLNYQTVEIRLVPLNTNVPGAPVALFTWAPTSPAVNEETAFNASSSFPVTGSSIVNYAWAWGDGTNDPTNAGPNEDHDWVGPGVYYVTLTVTDNLGQKGSATQAITVH
jgi:PKD domain-containing protein